jgi:hypothetical protein
VGLLKRVLYEPDNQGKIFLVIEYQQAEYVGCMLLDSKSFCEELASRLRSHQGVAIAAIGDLELALGMPQSVPAQG